MRAWLLIALLTAPSLFAADPPPGFTMTPGYEEVPSNHSYVQFDTRTIEDLAAGGRLQARKLEGRVWVMNIRPTGAQKRGDVQMADHEASLKSDGWTIIRDHGELEAKKRVGATTAWYQSFPNAPMVTILEETPPPRVLTLTAPKSAPETLAADGDYPYAAPFPERRCRRPSMRRATWTLRRRTRRSRSSSASRKQSGTASPKMFRPTNS